MTTLTPPARALLEFWHLLKTFKIFVTLQRISRNAWQDPEQAYAKTIVIRELRHSWIATTGRERV